MKNITCDNIIYVTLFIIISKIRVAGSQVVGVFFTYINIILDTHENWEVSADVISFSLNLAWVLSHHLQAVKHDDLELNFSKGGHDEIIKNKLRLKLCQAQVQLKLVNY